MRSCSVSFVPLSFLFRSYLLIRYFAGQAYERTALELEASGLPRSSSSVPTRPSVRPLPSSPIDQKLTRDDDAALDIWSAGIMLLCFLTRRFPFFNSNDDTEALIEIAAIFGRKKIERCAAGHSTSPPSPPPRFTSSRATQTGASSPASPPSRPLLTPTSTRSSNLSTRPSSSRTRRTRAARSLRRRKRTTRGTARASCSSSLIS